MTLPKISLAAATILVLSSMVFATEITVNNQGGTFSSPVGGGISLTAAQVSSTVGLPAFSGATIFSFSLGVPDSTTVDSKTWTSATVGNLTFTTSSFSFSGSFNCSSDCHYFGTSTTNGIFTGAFSGTLHTASGDVQIVGNTVETFGDFSVPAGNHGDSIAATVPEVGTLGLVGAGLIGIAVFTKRKFSGAVSSFRPL